MRIRLERSRWRQGRSRLLAAPLASAALLTAPAGAGADVAYDFGSNLVSPPSGANGCSTLYTSCTQWIKDLNPGNIAGTLASPIDGVVVSFTLRKNTNPSWTPLHLRIVGGPVAGNVWGGFAKSFPDVTPASSPGYESFPVRVPIAAGERVGIEQVGYTGASWAASGGPVFSAFMAFAQPGLPDDGSPVVGSTVNQELLLRARVEEDADHDGFGDETQDLCPTDASTQGACPVAPQPTAKKKRKKCKKGFKLKKVKKKGKKPKKKCVKKKKKKKKRKKRK